MNRFFVHVGAVCACLLLPTIIQAQAPVLPEANGPVEIAAQEWPLRPGPRTVRVLIHYPGGKKSTVNKDTGIMLTLHNWGGVDCRGTASPGVLAEKLNVIALCVNYLQSGPKDSIEGPEPYDFGYLQALDALRALHFVFRQLQTTATPFAPGRIYCTGGSGGGNVTLMANKLAPRTFACIIDMCGMARLTDAIAFNLPGSKLDARYVRDPKSPYYLSPDHQELRHVGNHEHLAVMKTLGSQAKIIIVHGTEDATCPFVDAKEMATNMKNAGLDVEPYFLTKKDLDGKIFSSTGHGLGDRTAIVFKVAGPYLEAGGAKALVRTGPTDFERKEDIRFPTSGGTFIISYGQGYPVGKFESAAAPPEYADHTDLTTFRDEAGKDHPIKTKADWEKRRQHIALHMQRVMGPLPTKRVPLELKVLEEKKVGNLIRKKVTFRSDAGDPVPAYIYLPPVAAGQKLPAMLCLHQTTKFGKDETAGVNGNANLKYGLELAERGYVTLMPDYPGFGDNTFKLDKQSVYVSGTMKAITDNIAAIDVLAAMPEVDAKKIGVIGHSLGGHNSMFTAFFDPRLVAIVSSCGFTTFRKDDMPSWTGLPYMPRIKTVFGNDAKKVPFDFQEIVAGFAPRAFMACAAEKDDDFDVSGVHDVMNAARPIYKLFGGAESLEGHYPPGPHAFPPDARQHAYRFLDRHLKE